MIKLSQAQMDRMDELYFYGRLKRFVASHCRNSSLQQWLSAQMPSHVVWSSVWPRLHDLNEHDCALLLIFLAVCDCEGIATGTLESLIAQLSQREIAVKSFLAERGYFHFSDFDLVAPDSRCPSTAG